MIVNIAYRMMPLMPKDATDQTLGEYVKEKLKGRSIRALATYANIGVGTASNLVNDKIDNPDAQTLIKVAEYLNVPVEILFRRAGYLPVNDTSDAEAILEVRRLMQQLPITKQQELLEITKTVYRLWKEERDRTSD